MKLFATLLFCGSFVLPSCTTLKTSPYAKHMNFTYQNEQPSPHFTNEKLNISGAFWWASGQRDIPKVSYLPDTIKRILRPISHKHGKVLFSTFNPAATKYRTADYIQVTKSEVRRWHRFLEPFYEVVLVSEKPFTVDTVNYKPVGFTADGSFTLYFKAPELRTNSYWVMETIAAENKSYYTFIVLMSKHYNMADSNNAAIQSKLFVEDVQQYFEKQDQLAVLESTPRIASRKKAFSRISEDEMLLPQKGLIAAIYTYCKLLKYNRYKQD